MAKAAVPRYLGQDFNETPPGHRFTLYGAFWEPEQGWQRVKNINPADLKRDFDRLPLEVSKLRDALRERQRHIAQTLGNAVLTFEAQSIAPFITGTGIEHPLENGMAFLNPYGLPYLPGSSVKGVLRRAAEELRDDIFGEGSKGWDPPAIDALFGKEPKSGDIEGEHTRHSALIFWDVFPKCEGLMVDIMNPHYGEYYQGHTTPHDSGQPIPIYFLTIPPKSQFTFHVQCNISALPGNLRGCWRDLLQSAFEHAFGWLGFGAKTAVGYGMMRGPKEIIPQQPSMPNGTAEPVPDAGKNQGSTKPVSGTAGGPQRWENVFLSWNKGNQQLYCSTAQGKGFTNGKEATVLRQKLSAEQQKKLDKGKPVTATVVAEWIGGSNWKITDID
jgi:CRISPR-associated protein Cmr6